VSLLIDVFVAISNARLALLVKDIELTWTNLVAIFAGIPGMVSNNFLVSCGTSEALYPCLYVGVVSYCSLHIPHASLVFLLLIIPFCSTNDMKINSLPTFTYCKQWIIP